MFNMQILTAVSVCSFDFILIVSASKLYGCICLVTNARGHSCVFSSGVFPVSSLGSLCDGWQVKHKRFTQLIPRPHFMPAYFKPPLCRMCATIY